MYVNKLESLHIELCFPKFKTWDPWEVMPHYVGVIFVFWETQKWSCIFKIEVCTRDEGQ